MPTRSVYDRKLLARILGEQFSVISRHQALECRLIRTRIDYLIRAGGPWQRVLPGVYAATNGSLTAEQRDMAALLHAGPGSVLTGHAAVTRHNVPCSGSNNIDVLVPAKSRVASAGFVRVIHSGRMPVPESVYSTGAIRFAALPRAVADAARGMKELSDVRAVVAAAVQRGRCAIPELVTELNDGPKTGSAMFHHALQEVSAGIRSAAEADLKDIIVESGLEEPLYNPELYWWDGTFIGIPDAWWQRAGVGAEIDSLQYHLSPEDYENTVMRHNRIQAMRINLLHFLPRTLKRDRRTVASTLQRAIEAGNRERELPIVAIPAEIALSRMW
jgi:hypothetical protein